MNTVLPAEPWVPPDPRQLPDWRARMIGYQQSNRGLEDLDRALAAGLTNMMPVFPAAPAKTLSWASAALARAECLRLERATLYYASADMTSLALAVGATPPDEPFKATRAPSPYGLMVFAEPIGGYEQLLDVALGVEGFALPGLSISMPIVAVSWSPWRADRIDGVPLNGQPMFWAHCTDEGMQLLHPGLPEGTWLTFYSAGSALEALPPQTIVALGDDGSPVAVRDILLPQPGIKAPLTWDNESVMFAQAGWEPSPAPDGTQRWAQVVYTAWQCMRQTSGKRALTEVEKVPRARAAAKRDARGPHPGADNVVRIVRVHASHRPSPQAADADAAASTGRRAPDWSHRWPVPPHRRRHCMNPALHRSGGCEHEDIIVPFHIKGPADKPLVIRETVHLWDRMPD